MRLMAHEGMRAALLLVVLSGCTSVPDKPTGEGDPPGQISFAALADPLAGPGEQRRYRMVVDLLFEKDRVYNARFGMDLDLASWVDPGGQRFVLLQQRVPSALVFTWREGLFGRRPYHADVKSAVELRDRSTTFKDAASTDFQRALTHGKQLIDRWRSEYKDLLGKHSWVHKPAIPFSAPLMKGQYGFYFDRSGAVPLDGEGRPLADAVRDQIELTYRWHEPGKEDPTENPRFFEALTASLAVFDVSPFPDGDASKLEGAASWTAKSEFAVSGLIRAARYFNSTVAGMLDEDRRVGFPLVGTLSDGVIVLSADEFPQPAVGHGYRLVKFSRTVRYDVASRVTRADEVHVVGRGSGGDRFQLRIALTQEGLE